MLKKEKRRRKETIVLTRLFLVHFRFFFLHLFPLRAKIWHSVKKKLFRINGFKTCKTSQVFVELFESQKTLKNELKTSQVIAHLYKHYTRRICKNYDKYYQSISV